jgi:hypothetical protein
VRIACDEVGRCAPRLRISGPELDDLAYQAAPDALLAITAKIGQFQGESRFRTWAYKFVIFEVSAKIGRHFGGTRACGWTPRTGSGCRTGLVSAPPRSRSGGICSPRCAAPWMRNSPRGSGKFSSRSWSARFRWRLPGVAALDAYGSAGLVLRAGNDGFRARPLWHQPSYCQVASRGMTGFRDHRPGSRPLDRSRDLKGEAPAGRHEDRAVRPALPGWTGPRQAAPSSARRSRMASVRRARIT